MVIKLSGQIMHVNHVCKPGLRELKALPWQLDYLFGLSGFFPQKLILIPCTWNTMLTFILLSTNSLSLVLLHKISYTLYGKCSSTHRCFFVTNPNFFISINICNNKFKKGSDHENSFFFQKVPLRSHFSSTLFSVYSIIICTLWVRNSPMCKMVHFVIGLGKLCVKHIADKAHWN